VIALGGLQGFSKILQLKIKPKLEFFVIVGLDPTIPVISDDLRKFLTKLSQIRFSLH